MTKNTDYDLIESKRISYRVNNSYYIDTKYNNTFVFENSKNKITLYFQPVIYGDDRAFNGLNIFRNTSTNSRKDNNKKGKTYTPDYIIKAEYSDDSNQYMADYIILDAKFSRPDNIRLHQLQELVYKYIFSISSLKEEERILGLYILCGKQLGKDSEDIVHDLADTLGVAVSPFAELLSMNGDNVSDYSIPFVIFNNII